MFDELFGMDIPGGAGSIPGGALISIGAAWPGMALLFSILLPYIIFSLLYRFEEGGGGGNGGGGGGNGGGGGGGGGADIFILFVRSR